MKERKKCLSKRIPCKETQIKKMTSNIDAITYRFYSIFAFTPFLRCVWRKFFSFSFIFLCGGVCEVEQIWIYCRMCLGQSSIVVFVWLFHSGELKSRPCPFEWQSYPAIPGSCYRFIDSFMGYDAARANCRSLHPQADLMIVDSVVESKFVRDTIPRWIGEKCTLVTVRRQHST